MSDLTPVFPAHQAARPGVYLVPTKRAQLYAYWDGQHWGCTAATVDQAAAKPDFEFAKQAKPWRGLAADPSLQGSTRGHRDERTEAA